MAARLPMARECVFVDVDGTLIKWRRRRGRLENTLNKGLAESLAEWGAHADLVLWSRRGRLYAQKMAERHKVAHLFVAIIGKPTAIIDDEGLSWMKGVRLNAAPVS